jgi:hypothetical protein
MLSCCVAPNSDWGISHLITDRKRGGDHAAMKVSLGKTDISEVERIDGADGVARRGGAHLANGRRHEVATIGAARPHCRKSGSRLWTQGSVTNAQNVRL